MKHLAVGVAGMSCQGCVKNVTSVLQALPGVAEVKVSLEEARAEISYDPQLVKPIQFKDAIEDGNAARIDGRLDALLEGYFAGKIPEGAWMAAYSSAPR